MQAASRDDLHENESSGYIWHMFSGWRMTLMSTIMCFNWFASSLCYYGLTFNSTNLGSNAYASFALSMIVELPALVLGHILALKVGRRLPLLVSMIAGGVCLLLTFAFKPGNWCSSNTYKGTGQVLQNFLKSAALLGSIKNSPYSHWSLIITANLR